MSNEKRNPETKLSDACSWIQYFCVCHDTVIDGQRIHAHRLSPLYSQMEKAQEVYPEIKARVPDAYLGGGTRYFYNAVDDPAEFREREEFIQTLR